MNKYMSEVNGQIELNNEGMNKISVSTIANSDNTPLPIANRVWGAYNYFALWIGIVYCVPTLLLTGGMLPKLAWWQALMAIAIGSFCMSILMFFSGHGGAKYGIPMGVLARASWGIRGSHLALFIRASVAIGYVGIETFIGGAAINGLLTTMFNVWGNIEGNLWFAVAIFVVIELFFIWFSSPSKEMKAYKILNAVALPGMLLMGIILVTALYLRVGNWGPIFSTPAALEGKAWSTFFISCLVGAFGYWGESMTHYSDLSRFSKDNKKFAIGSVFGVTLGMVSFGIIGIASGSFGKVLFGETIWNPIDIIVKLDMPILAFFSLIFIILVTLTTNLGANLTPSGFFFSNLFPKCVSWRIGCIIALVISLALRPWVLLESFGAFLFDWLLLWMCWIAPLAGIMICDYWLIRKTKLDVTELYNPEGIYKYANGFNPVALIAWAIGTGISLYNKNISFIVGLPVGMIVYYFLMKSWGIPKYQPSLLNKDET